MAARKVIVLGGGIGGMSAAHELIERGYDVEVHEYRSVCGGKARSIFVPDTGTDGRKDLPGEHGFRFFPAFYRHIIDTMQRTPDGHGGTCADHLTQTSRIQVARLDKPPIDGLARFPRTLADLKLLIHDITDDETHVPTEEKEFFAERIWQLVTSCWDRRREEYDRLGWWQYVQAARMSKNYQLYYAIGLSRTLVAARTQESSVKSGGDVMVQLLLGMLEPGKSTDRVLDGPTSTVWLDPWLDYLRSKGVRYYLDSEVKHIHCDGVRITGVTVRRGDGEEHVSGDYYVSALPVEVMAEHLTREMLEADRTLENVKTLANCVRWMNGIQFFLNEDVPIIHGHSMYIDSPWALTSISQKQFWKNVDLSTYGNGKIRGILSVDVSVWTEPGFNGKRAEDCTPEEVKDEVWEELKRSLNVDGQVVLRDDMIESWYLCPDVIYRKSPHGPDHGKVENGEPLLVNMAGGWALRPEAFTYIPNLFLASDYVRTFTDLATMEGANEAARRAVNALLDADRSRASRCGVWNLHEPDILAPWRLADSRRWRKGLPWNGELAHGFWFTALGALVLKLARTFTRR